MTKTLRNLEYSSSLGRVKTRRNPSDLLNKSRVNPIRIPKIGKALRERKRKRLMLSNTYHECSGFRLSKLQKVHRKIHEGENSKGCTDESDNKESEGSMHDACTGENGNFLAFTTSVGSTVILV